MMMNIDDECRELRYDESWITFVKIIISATNNTDL